MSQEESQEEKAKDTTISRQYISALVVVSPFVGYLAAYLIRLGEAGYYRIPSSYVSVGIEDALLAGSVVIIAAAIALIFYHYLTKYAPYKIHPYLSLRAAIGKLAGQILIRAGKTAEKSWFDRMIGQDDVARRPIFAECAQLNRHELGLIFRERQNLDKGKEKATHKSIVWLSFMVVFCFLVGDSVARFLGSVRR